jgi:indolepyruvate ferredoxin oxidoreductase beta subunit
MKYDIVLAGVGGQGVLSMAAIIGRAALAEGLYAKQSEIHGMAQRAGAVQAHLRLSDLPIESDLIGVGGADLILSLEPVECLRYLPYLGMSGTAVTAANPYLNVKSYPPLRGVLESIRSLPRAIVVDAERIANDAGDIQAMNSVMVGAASGFLPLAAVSLEAAVRETFGKKGGSVVGANLTALRAGREAAACVPSTASMAESERPGFPVIWS